MHLASIKVPRFLRRGRNKNTVFATGEAGKESKRVFCSRGRKNTLFSAKEAGNKNTVFSTNEAK